MGLIAVSIIILPHASGVYLAPWLEVRAVVSRVDSGRSGAQRLVSASPYCFGSGSPLRRGSGALHTPHKHLGAIQARVLVCSWVCNLAHPMLARYLLDARCIDPICPTLVFKHLVRDELLATARSSRQRCSSAVPNVVVHPCIPPRHQPAQLEFAESKASRRPVQGGHPFRPCTATMYQ